jgi:hypothetical protein
MRIVDVLAHGLWGGALFGHKSEWQWRAAFLIGAAPDVIAFGPFLITQVGNNNWVDFPPYVHQTYNVTHSLVVWSAVTALVWLLTKTFPVVLCAWGFHIVCDIPLHEITFFPTPFLWPFRTPFVNGIRWAQLWLLFPNYLALTIVYKVWLGRRRPNPS